MSRSNTYRIGTDIEEVSRFENTRSKSKFAQNVFLKNELAECKAKQNEAQSLAARFAAKEAVIKCIDKPFAYNKIEIRTESEKPFVVVYDENINKQWEFELSISHTRQLAQATCLAIKK